MQLEHTNNNYTNIRSHRHTISKETRQKTTKEAISSVTLNHTATISINFLPLCAFLTRKRTKQYTKPGSRKYLSEGGSIDLGIRENDFVVDVLNRHRRRRHRVQLLNDVEDQIELSEEE